MNGEAFLKISRERGYIQDLTNEANLIEHTNKKSISIMYIGFDCTAPSLHIGSLVQIMLLRLWQKLGNKPIVLLGGATTKVGDPSGKDKTRAYLSNREIEFNMQQIGKIFSKFLNFNNSANSAIILNNAEWLDDIKYIDFLRQYGSQFSVNRMLSLESVKQRLNRQEEMSFIEFNYVLMQSYDFLNLNINYNCSIQAGGSDQWGNIVNGIELNRKLGKPECYGITTPLITTSSGKKMGKTANGAIWLNEEYLQPYDYWQYFRNVSDSDIEKFLKLFTDLPMQQIEKLKSLQNEQINEAKKILASEATKICHGTKATENAREMAQSIFETNNGQQDKKFPNFVVNNNSYLKQLIVDIGFANSASEAKRLIKTSSVKLNDTTIVDENYMLSLKLLPATLSVGKKRKIRLTN
ncbi:Tyrosine--tRNA ligase [Candidatus Xenohaliotis californiensis]|uniref:Tyrosine--tRNA ligase n=1 Tax=Candidatus Xenohaliotis californiensis TaxID=84677 RepID=A0ABM9N8Z6_9RICK|nr:Tyrosine--tRNA ligase [Candidatus Xenohaliotis californiensis]